MCCICGSRSTLVVEPDAAVLEPHVAGVPLARVGEHGHQRRLSALAEGFDDGRVGRIEPAIAVHHQKRVAEFGQRCAQRAAGAEQLRAVDPVADRDAKPASVADIGLDLLREIAGADHHARHALAAQQPELVRDERLAGDVQHRLGHRFR